MADFKINGFDLIEKVGEGGMGQVWKARQLSLDRLVAIKFLSPRQSHDPESIKQIIHEARTAAKLKHPGIVHMYDTNEQDGQSCLVMEFVDGYNVGQWIKRKTLISPRDALLVVESVAIALRYAWREAGLIHCDIKPENIMVDQDGTIKVADLGLSITRDSQGEFTPKDEVVGTPGYIAPEQVEGNVALDCRADIYSLGCCLYHMVTGVRPFSSLPDGEAMEAHVTSQIPDPRDLVPEVPGSVCALIEWMLIKDRDQRLANWDVVLKELHRLQKGAMLTRGVAPEGASTLRRRVQTAAPAPVESKPTPAPASSRMAAILMVGAVIASIQIAGIWWFSRKSEPVAPPASIPMLEVTTPLSAPPVLEPARDGRSASGPNQLDKDRKIARELRAIKRTVDEFIASSQYAEAIEWLEGYSSQYPEATNGLRNELLAELKGKLKAVEDSRLGEVEWTNRLNAILSSVLSGKYPVARQLTDEALKQEILQNHKQELMSIGRILDDVVALPDKILATFQGDIGKELTLPLVRGPFQGRLLAIKDRKLILKTADESAQLDLRFEEISPAERQARLIALELPEGNLLRGVAAYNAGKDEEAEALLTQTASKLGPMLIERKKADAAAVAKAIVQASEHAAEEEALRADPAFIAFAKLLKRSGIDLIQYELSKMKGAIESTTLSRDVALQADKALDGYLEKYGTSSFAEKYAELVLAFQGACGQAIRQK